MGGISESELYWGLTYNSDYVVFGTITHPSGNDGNLSDPDSFIPRSPVTVLGEQALSVGIYMNDSNSISNCDSFPQSGLQIKEPLACGYIIFEGRRTLV